MKGEIELYNISFLILKVNLHFKEGKCYHKQFFLKVKKEVNESFLSNFFKFENIHKYSKIQYQGETVYFHKPNP